LPGVSDTFSETWPTSGSMRSGVCSERTTSVRRTGGSASSSWPTSRVARGPYCRDHGDPDRPVLTLEGAAENWPTPRTITGGAESAERKQELGREESGGGDLQAVVEKWATPMAEDSEAAGSERYNTNTLTKQTRAWATPTSRDWKRGDIPNRVGSPALSLQVQQTDVNGPESSSGGPSSLPPCPTVGAYADNRYPTPAADEYTSSQNEGPVPHQRPSNATPSLTGWTRRRLNPLFDEWLMGLPIGWTGSAPVEMESFRQWQLSHSELLRRL